MRSAFDIALAYLSRNRWHMMGPMEFEHLAEYVVDSNAHEGAREVLNRKGSAEEAVDDERAGDYPLVRFQFALPSPLPVPNGWAIGMEPGKGSPPDCPMAFLTFWQERYRWTLSRLSTAQRCGSSTGSRSDGRGRRRTR